MIEKQKITVKQMSTVALMTAVTCVLAPVSVVIPTSPVPVTFTTLAICFSLYVLGMKWGTISYLLYLLIGMTGIPVFSGFTGGPAKLLGPTGGYLLGFIFMCLISGPIIDKFYKNHLLSLAGMILGMAVCYVFGTIWLAYQGNMSFTAALSAAVLPFIPADLIKMCCVLLVGPKIRKSLVRGGFIS